MWQATSPFHNGHKYLAVERRSKNGRLGRRLRAPPHPHKRRENILLLQTESAISPLPLPLPLPRRPRPTRPDRTLIVSISEPATNSVGRVGQSRPPPLRMTSFTNMSGICLNTMTHCPFPKAETGGMFGFRRSTGVRLSSDSFQHRLN